MESMIVETKRRWDLGKNGSHRLRVTGWIPAVIYGKDEASVPVAVDRKLFDRLLHTPGGKNRTYKLQMDENTVKEVLVKDYQLDPVHDTLTHIDFLAVREDRPVQVRVPIETHGVAVGVKTFGGILGVLLRELPVECLPQNIPDAIRIDVTPLNIGHGLKVKDIAVGENVKILANPDQIVVHVEGTRGAETAAAEGEAK